MSDPGVEPSLLNGIATTRSIRRYRPDPVPTEDLNTILFAATRAPQGSNRQGFRFVVLRDGPRALEARRLIGEGARSVWADKRVTDAYDRGSGAADDSPKARMARTMQHFVDHVHEAPVIVLACLHCHRAPSLALGGAVWPAVQNLLLGARALGYGGVITGWHGPREAEIRQVLGMPADPDRLAIAATIPLGRPVGGHGPVRRRPLAEVVYEDGWGEAAPWAVDPEGARFTAPGPPSGLRL
ncbi:MAG: nitroreductase family protein [Actinobacteria bacterium]|nr:nitroreductase family protein [Actinomycetota bacterium]